MSLRRITEFEEMNQQREIIADLIPEIKIMFDYNQRNSAHQYDLWRHSVETMLNLPESGRRQSPHNAANNKRKNSDL